jgi:hypothetical protein
MEGQRNKLYQRADDFFDLGGSAVMYLTPAAAVDVCLDAARRGLLVARVEGGIWHDPGFEARIDCIWDGADPPIATSAAIRNNEEAADFIRAKSSDHDAFVLTAPPVTGWPHKHS